jgi:hypothetical protein
MRSRQEICELNQKYYTTALHKCLTVSCYKSIVRPPWQVLYKWYLLVVSVGVPKWQCIAERPTTRFVI